MDRSATRTVEAPPGSWTVPELLRLTGTARRAHAADAERRLPGDPLLPKNDVSTTRALTIPAAPQQVWPWVAQIGQGRGGFYSYDRLENLFGCRIHSADWIHPEWQSPAIGSAVNLAPGFALTVVEVDPGVSLVLRGGTPAAAGSPPFDFTWCFALVPLDDGSRTRLLVREHYAYLRPVARFVVRPLTVISGFMSRKMLRGIRDRVRAESHLVIRR